MINDGWNKKPEGWEEVNIHDYKNIVNKIDISFNYDSIFVLAGGINQNGECHEWVKRRLDLAVKLHNFSNKNNEDVIGNGSYICKPQTKLTIEWYNSVIQLLNSKLEELKKYPAKYPQDSFGVNNSKYPIRWEEMLACIFDPLCYEYKDKILNTLPINIFESYR